MRPLRIHPVAGLGALLLACGGSGGEPHGLDRRVEVAPLPLPTGLPSPIAVTWTNAFPALQFYRPVLLTAPPDGSDRIVVVEQAGRVHVLPNDPAATTTTVMLDLSSTVLFGGEQGLLGLAFHPDHASNGWLYVYYSLDAPRRTHLSRFTISSNRDVVDASSELVLLEIEQPFSNHNAGALAFGPDGKLYVACGDGGSGNDPLDQAQDPTTLLGSILRLEDDGTAPPDNPFSGSPNGERPEIWAYGLRNPWRMSFDRLTGELWCGDVGQGAVEEIDRIVRGGNYGWPVYEGLRENRNPLGLPPSAFESPVHTYTHAEGLSITGGHVYRGTAVPSLVGAYVYADFVSGRVAALVHDGVQAIDDVVIATANSPASFGEDEAGELYLCCFDGIVRRLAPDPTPAPPSSLPPQLSGTGLFADTNRMTPAPGVIEYDVQSPLWSDGARKRRWIALPGISRIVFSPDGAYAFPVGTAIVKHFEFDTAPGVTTRLETRVLLHQASGWLGFTYRWNGAGTDATLVDEAGESFSFDVSEGSGATTTRTWTIPGRGACFACHTQAAGRVLGVRTRQLNHDFPYPLAVDNQLRAWNHIGLFTTDVGAAAQYPANSAPEDPTQPVGARARAYLDTNCSSCHRPDGPTPVDLDLRASTTIPDMRLFGVATSVSVPGGSGQRAVPGDHASSELWLRTTRRDGFAMPPLGSHVVDTAASALIAAWIDSDPTAGQ